MMSAAHDTNTDPYEIDVLAYLTDLDGDLDANERRGHYTVLRPALAHLQQAEPITFDLALGEISEKLGIKVKTVKADLATLTAPAVAKEARDLLEKMGQTRVLRLAQDYQDGRLSYGIIAGDEKLLLNSDRELLTLDALPDGLTVQDNGFDLCRVSKDAVLAFLSGGTAPGHELLVDLQTFFARFAVFRDKRVPLLLAIWTLGTYCYQVFRVFPYLALRSPEKRCGKSRVLDLLTLLAFNASQKTVHPTEAQLFRSPSRNGGTLLLDEVEALGKADKDTYAGLLAVLNSGFEKNGTVERQVKDGTGNFHGVNFPTYCPRAIAGISRTADTLEDRSIMIVMQRKLSREKTERFSPSRLEEEAQALRDRCYLWTLTHAVDLAAVYDTADRLFLALESLDDRARDLWEPLMSIAAVADVERGDGLKTLTDELTALAYDLCQVRDGAADDSTTVQIINALLKIATEKVQGGIFQTDQDVTLAPSDLAPLLKEKLGWERLSTKGLASLLHPLGLFATQTRTEEKIVRAYHLSIAALTELSERYAQTNPENGEQ